MLSPKYFLLNIWPEAGCPVIISTEMFGPVLVIKYVVLLNETRISAVFDMVIFPTRSVTFPRYQEEQYADLLVN